MARSDLRSTSNLQRAFPHTRWSLVIAANREKSPAANAALESICRTYWYPLYAFVRRAGHSPHDAQDLTQEFFRCLIEKRWLHTADPDKGRLRTFMIVALKRFMAKERRRSLAQRRGGTHPHVEFDTHMAEDRYASSGAHLREDEVFDRQWALTVLELTIERLKKEFTSAGKLGDFEILKDCLMAPHGTIDYSKIAEQLGVNPVAARVAVHRLRRRFREFYRIEVSQTLAEGSDLEAEVRYLAAALGRE